MDDADSPDSDHDSSDVGRPDDRDPDDPRHETRAQRYDRNLNELLQELRVAGIGVQVLFGFLLSLPFTNRFEELDGGERDLYGATLVLSAVAVALLIAPAAYHRIVFHLQQKERLLQYAQWTSLLGLACAALAISGATALVLRVVFDSGAVPLLVGLVAGTYALCWFVLPLAARMRARHRHRDARS